MTATTRMVGVDSVHLGKRERMSVFVSASLHGDTVNDTTVVVSSSSSAADSAVSPVLTTATVGNAPVTPIPPPSKASKDTEGKEATTIHMAPNLVVPIPPQHFPHVVTEDALCPGCVSYYREAFVRTLTGARLIIQSSMEDQEINGDVIVICPFLKNVRFIGGNTLILSSCCIDVQLAVGKSHYMALTETKAGISKGITVGDYANLHLELLLRNNIMYYNQDNDGRPTSAAVPPDRFAEIVATRAREVSHPSATISSTIKVSY